MALYINDILWEPDFFHSGELRFDKEKYNLHNLGNYNGDFLDIKWIRNNREISNENTGESITDNLELLAILLLQNTYGGWLYVEVDIMPYQRSDKPTNSKKDRFCQLSLDGTEHSLLHWTQQTLKHNPTMGKAMVNDNYVQGIIQLIDVDNRTLVFPDETAVKRLNINGFKEIIETPHIICSKTRTMGGIETKFDYVSTEIKPHFVIVDDIVSMGGSVINVINLIQDSYGKLFDNIEITIKVEVIEQLAWKHPDNKLVKMIEENENINIDLTDVKFI